MSCLTSNQALALNCTSEEELQHWEHGMDPLKKLYNVLMVSGRAAINKGVSTHSQHATDGTIRHRQYIGI